MIKFVVHAVVTTVLVLATIYAIKKFNVPVLKNLAESAQN